MQWRLVTVLSGIISSQYGFGSKLIAYIRLLQASLVSVYTNTLRSDQFNIIHFLEQMQSKVLLYADDLLFISDQSKSAHIISKPN